MQPMRIVDYLDSSFPCEISIYDDSFNITIKGDTVSIDCDLKGYDSRLSGCCEIKISDLLEALNRFNAAKDKKGANDV